MQKPVKCVITMTDVFGEKGLETHQLHVTVPLRTVLGRLRQCFVGLIAHENAVPQADGQGDQVEVKRETSKRSRKSKDTSN